MNKITHLFFLTFISISFAQNGPINFETTGNGSNWTWKTFQNGTDLPLQIITNPFPTGINTSATVAKMTTLVIGAPFAGVENIHPASTPVGGPSPFGNYTITAANCTVRIMVYKSVISPVGIKFVTATNGSTGEIKVSNTLINQWEELVFDFSSKIGETNDQIVIFPDFQARTTDNVCYFDSISFGPEIEKPVLPIDFESTTLTYLFNDFGNASTSKISNPYMIGSNLSSNVGKTTKNLGETWAGTFIDLGATIDFSTFTSIKMKVWSQYPGVVVKLKLENPSNPTVNIESDVTNTLSNAWEELTFSFPGIVNANNYKRIVVFFNFGFSGNGESYYFDDIALTQGLSNENFTLNQQPLVYPNPSNGLFTISLKDEIKEVTVSTLLGQQVLKIQPNSNSVAVDISNFSNGIYLINFSSNSKRYTSKFIKK